VWGGPVCYGGDRFVGVGIMRGGPGSGVWGDGRLGGRRYVGAGIILGPAVIRGSRKGVEREVTSDRGPL